MDCLGCGNCADVCPGFEGQQGIVYGSAGTGQLAEAPITGNYCVKLTCSSKQNLVDVKSNVKNSQFATTVVRVLRRLLRLW